MAEKSIRVWLIRHGKTEKITDGPACIGITDVPLSAEGRAGMMRLGLRAMEREPEFIRNAAYFTSPLQRCVFSGDAFLKGCGLTGTDLVSFQGLREVSLGTWDGLSFSEIRKKYPDAYLERGKHPGTYRTPGGETIEEAASRFRETLLRLARGTGGNLIVFSHSGVISGLLCMLRGISCNEFKSIPLPCGSITELRIEADCWKIYEFGRAFI